MHQRTAALPRPSVVTTVVAVVAASVLTDVAAQVSIGWPVPITLQTFAVLGTAAWLGARRAAAAQMLYLAQGAVGLPVFAEGHAGYQWLTSPDSLHPSGGYLWGYPIAALIVGGLCERYGRTVFVAVPAMLLGSAALYSTGLVWLHAAVPSSWHQTVAWGLQPFVLGDLAKIFAAALIVDPAAPWAGLLARLRLE
jgi:biotin transport system substrate-specific component